jgi:hypothetical protein
MAEPTGAAKLSDPNIPFPPLELSLACRAGPSAPRTAASLRARPHGRRATGRSTGHTGAEPHKPTGTRTARKPGSQPTWIRRCSSRRAGAAISAALPRSSGRDARWWAPCRQSTSMAVLWAPLRLSRIKTEPREPGSCVARVSTRLPAATTCDGHKF